MKISSLLTWCASASLLAATPSLHAQLGTQPGIGANAPTGTATSLTSASPMGSKSVDLEGNPVNNTFSNQTGTSVKVYWVDYNGINQEVGTLFAGQAAQITTYPGHVTVFTSNGQQVAKYVATAGALGTTYAIVGNSSSNTGSAGGNNFASGGGFIPQNSTFIPANFLQNQGAGGGLGNQSGMSPMPLSDLDRFIRSLSSSVGSNNNLGLGTTTQTNNGVNNLATLIQMAQNRKNGAQTGTNLLTANTTQAIETGILNAVNQDRSTLGMAALPNSAAVAVQARQYSSSQMVVGNMSHNGMVPRLQSAAAAMGIAYIGGSENLAWAADAGTAQVLARKIVDQWMNDPNDKRNILDPNAKHIGVGVAKNPLTGKVFVTTLFLY